MYKFSNRKEELYSFKKTEFNQSDSHMVALSLAKVIPKCKAQFPDISDSRVSLPCSLSQATMLVVTSYMAKVILFISCIDFGLILIL